MSDKRGELLLGKNVPVADEYSPGLLYPIPRSHGRQSILANTQLPFYGADLWHAYEISWLNASGVPCVRVGRFTIPAASPNLIESKSFKLYLNSLNGSRFCSEEEVHALILADISRAAGAPVELTLFAVDDPALRGIAPEGECIDDTELEVVAAAPGAELLGSSDDAAQEILYSHLLRSLCPVTGQPDWATVRIAYRGRRIDRASLLQYIISFRQHQEFHEQCVERMFVDISACCKPAQLQIQAFYTRRGGLDINPYRSSEAGGRALPRMDRQ